MAYHEIGKKSIGRRHSAPETDAFNDLRANRRRVRRNVWSSTSAWDFSILLEHQSESASSLELDTSNLSRDLTPGPTSKSSVGGSYQNLPETDHQEETVEETSSWSLLVLASWLTWRNIILSQAAAGFLAVMIVSNGNIMRHPNRAIVNGRNLLHYVLLGGFWTTKLAYRRNVRDLVEIVRFGGLRYLCLSILHVEVNYLLLTSFRHGTHLGNQVIDCVAASLSLVVAHVLLEARYHPIHVSGFGLAILGGIGLSAFNSVARMAAEANGQEASLGDFLRTAAGICLAYNSLTQEIVVRATDHVEYMGMIGLMGSVVCGFQALISEAHEILPKNRSFWLNVSIFSLARFSFDSLTPRILRESGATGFHLNLISSGLYSQFAGFILEGDEFPLYQFPFYATAIIGSSLFAVRKAAIGIPYSFPVEFVFTENG